MHGLLNSTTPKHITTNLKADVCNRYILKGKNLNEDLFSPPLSSFFLAAVNADMQMHRPFA